MAKILFVTLEPQAFLNQRLSLANGLREAGHEVSLATYASVPASTPLTYAAARALSYERGESAGAAAAARERGCGPGGEARDLPRGRFRQQPRAMRLQV